MEKRLEQIAPDLPYYFKLNECMIGEPLQDKYTGAGVAIIICTGDTILDLEYVESDAQISGVITDAVLSGCEVYFGMCSCVCFTDPLKISDANGIEDALKMMLEHGLKHNFFGS